MTNEATIIRVASRRNNPYFLMCRQAAQNTKLTYEAVGLLAYLLSKPDNWTIRVKDLQNECTQRKVGKNKVYALIKELREAGYVTGHTKTQVNGSWIWEPYYIHDTPYSQNRETDEASPQNREIIVNTEGGVINDEDFWSLSE